MKQKKVYIMCGPAAAGKTSWVKNNSTEHSYHASRDTVRFSLVSEDEDYFSKENEVFKTWRNNIQSAINSDEYDSVYIDATNLNPSSRNKILGKLQLTNCELIAVNFYTPIEVCLERNSNRTGRERVPDKAIMSMAARFVPASAIETFKFDKIIEVY